MNALKKAILNVWPELLVLVLSWPIGMLSSLGTKEMLILTFLLIGQNASFTVVSRARQSTNLKLHAIAAIGSNGFFIFIISTVAQHYNNFWLKFWYIICTVVGSVHAHYISLHKIENSKHFRKDSLVSREELAKELEIFALTNGLKGMIRDKNTPLQT